MANIRCQARFTLVPASDENVAVNTFHFQPAGPYVSVVGAALVAVRDFYEFTAGASGQTNPVGADMGLTVLRPYEIRAYDLDTPEPRVPTILASTLPPVEISNPVNIPYDVAFTLSYAAAPPVTRRRRGRIYIPGVHDVWMRPGTALVPPQFDNQIGAPANNVLAAANHLISTPGILWSVRSAATVPPSMAIIASASYDLEPDTQRRRGRKVTTRVTSVP